MNVTSPSERTAGRTGVIGCSGTVKSGSDPDKSSRKTISARFIGAFTMRWSLDAVFSESGESRQSTTENVVVTVSETRWRTRSPTVTAAVTDPVGHSMVSNVVAVSQV